MKSVLISVRPKWCGKITHQIDIVDGKPVYEKTIEIRKAKPKCDVPFKCYIYETKGKKHIHNHMAGYEYDKHGMIVSSDVCSKTEYYDGCGKVIGEFVCDEIYEIDSPYLTWLEEKSCVCMDKIAEYQGERDYIYGWQISKLKIYDVPKELSEYHKTALSYDDWLYGIYNGNSGETSNYSSYLSRYIITKPPQSWCYVETCND